MAVAGLPHVCTNGSPRCVAHGLHCSKLHPTCAGSCDAIGVRCIWCCQSKQKQLKRRAMGLDGIATDVLDNDELFSLAMLKDQVRWRRARVCPPYAARGGFFRKGSSCVSNYQLPGRRHQEGRGACMLRGSRHCDSVSPERRNRKLVRPFPRNRIQNSLPAHACVVVWVAAERHRCRI
jgi:hypothetical protein